MEAEVRPVGGTVRAAHGVRPAGSPTPEKHAQAGPARRLALPIFALWQREMVRFVRQRSRVTGALAQPIVFWLLLGGGLNASFQPAGAPPGTTYVEYFYPGIIILVLLFTAIFSTISTVEDRREGFLQGVLAAPVPRWAIVLGQALGGTSLAVLQGMLLLFLAPLLGIPLSVAAFFASLGMMLIISLALTGLGLVIAWRMESTQGFHAIMNLILIPIWLLSGAFFPASGAPAPLAWLMRIDPLTYGMAGLRHCLYLNRPDAVGAIPSMPLSLGISVGFGVVALLAAARTAGRTAP